MRGVYQELEIMNPEPRVACAKKTMDQWIRMDQKDKKTTTLTTFQRVP